jgi:hypothetical protein
VRWPALLLAWWCALPVPASAAAGYDARYRLLLDGDPVGQVVFRVRVAEDSYSVEAFTVPDGEMARSAPQHEVLEISEGTWRDGGPVPAEYVYHLRDSRGDHLFEQRFDWAAGKLHLSYEDASETTDLEPGTQDRLSYLLQLAQAVRADRAEFAFAVAEPEATVPMRFRALQREQLELAAGSAEAVGVDCFTAGETPDRTIWVVPAWQHIPGLIERAVPEGRVRMELVGWEAR